MSLSIIATALAITISNHKPKSSALDHITFALVTSRFSSISFTAHTFFFIESIHVKLDDGFVIANGIRGNQDQVPTSQIKYH
jgi:hypothetical protein